MVCGCLLWRIPGTSAVEGQGGSGSGKRETASHSSGRRMRTDLTNSLGCPVARMALELSCWG